MGNISREGFFMGNISPRRLIGKSCKARVRALLAAPQMLEVNEKRTKEKIKIIKIIKNNKK